ncbi:unnamed protein product [Cylicostephanus goldi]|uniref:Uncharacterized protein n=1 Tax=Cylicostephanus goldi TaxID=71465 RepID=A0A3P6RDF0_CYLGO|nr:unnamed protein product [Cylicostephanus goldi]
MTKSAFDTISLRTNSDTDSAAQNRAGAAAEAPEGGLGQGEGGDPPPAGPETPIQSGEPENAQPKESAEPKPPSAENASKGSGSQDVGSVEAGQKTPESGDRKSLVGTAEGERKTAEPADRGSRGGSADQPEPTPEEVSLSSFQTTALR